MSVTTMNEPFAELLREAIDAQLREPLGLTQYIGPDWWQLSETEVKVFGISPARWPLLLVAYCAYPAFADVTDVFNLSDEIDKRYTCAGVWAILDAARRLHPDWGTTPETFSASGFARMAKTYVSIPHREVIACWHKMHWSDVRSGVIEYADERVPGPLQRRGVRRPAFAACRFECPVADVARVRHVALVRPWRAVLYLCVYCATLRPFRQAQALLL